VRRALARLREKHRLICRQSPIGPRSLLSPHNSLISCKSLSISPDCLRIMKATSRVMPAIRSPVACISRSCLPSIILMMMSPATAPRIPIIVSPISELSVGQDRSWAWGSPLWCSCKGNMGGGIVQNGYLVRIGDHYALLCRKRIGGSKGIAAPASWERTSRSPHRHSPADTPRPECIRAPRAAW
jgi:hypothetical protein